MLASEYMRLSREDDRESDSIRLLAGIQESRDLAEALAAIATWLGDPIEKLRKAGLDSWDKVDDPEALLKELRD